jgi:hypothetical protein
VLLLSGAIQGSKLENNYVIPSKRIKNCMKPSKEAVILVNKGHYANNLLITVWDMEHIKGIQKKVIDKEIIPLY